MKFLPDSSFTVTGILKKIAIRVRYPVVEQHDIVETFDWDIQILSPRADM
jgi:hypothetical protein